MVSSRSCSTARTRSFARCRSAIDLRTEVKSSPEPQPAPLFTFSTTNYLCLAVKVTFISGSLGVRVESGMLEEPPDRRRHLPLMLGLATSGPICRTARPHSRSRQTSISERFSSMTNRRFENPFVLEQPARQFHGFRDRLHRHLPPPRPHDALPRRAAGHLLQHLEQHHARAFERRLAVAHLRIRHDVLAEFHPLLLAVAVRFHEQKLPQRTSERNSTVMRCPVAAFWRTPPDSPWKT